ncbi:MAG: polysaccharide deacetylase family protein [Pseudobdellovibrionaceae bacterium]
MKKTFLTISILALSAVTALSYAQTKETWPKAPSEKQLIDLQTKEGLLRHSDLWGLNDLYNSNCKYSIQMPDTVTKGTIALTFDDGPNAATTPLILNVLKAHNAKATFFVLGDNIKGNEALLNRMLQEGHHIGNHSYSHPNFHQLSSATANFEISATDALLRKVTQPVYFRFPYGNSTCGARELVRSKGYRIVGWNIDSCDWAYADGVVSGSENATCQAPRNLRRDYFNYVLRGVARTQGGVMLMHDIHRNTAQSLDRLLYALEKEGYRFVTLDDTNIFPKLNEL